jgi:hypothetical protein
MAHRLPRPTPENLRESLSLSGGHTKIARLLREAERSPDAGEIERAFEEVETIIQEHSHGATFGVEAISGTTWDRNGYFGDSVALYINNGDSYAATIVYDVGQDLFYVCGYADWIEDYEQRGGAVR